MSESEDQPETAYQVVLNHEEQYSIWPVDRDIPNGWRAEGTSGTKAKCLAHIDEVWTDMRPLSLRRHMAEMAQRQPEEPSEAVDDPADDEESLVSRLSSGTHPVEVSLRPERTAPALREAIDRGYVLIRFTGTRGTTELGIRLDRDATDLGAADFERPSGLIRLVGDLVLDFEPVRCAAEIDLATMSGHGGLSARELSQ